MTPEEFTYLSDLLREQTGVSLSEDKSAILEAKLMAVVRSFDFNGLSDLVAALKQGDGEVMEAFTEALAVNETLFFRDILAFRHLEEMAFPFLLKNRREGSTIRILCAGCSSGQEPYSVAMVVKDFLEKNPSLKVEIVAIDISASMLSKAKGGIYTQFDVQRGLPIKMLLKNFTKESGAWHINDDLKQMVTFKKLNLLNDLTPLGKFDVIFCRHLIKHFDLVLKPVILEKFADILNPDGLLFLGEGETTLGLTESFRSVVKSVPYLFQKIGA